MQRGTPDLCSDESRKRPEQHFTTSIESSRRWRVYQGSSGEDDLLEKLVAINRVAKVREGWSVVSDSRR